MNQPWLRVFKLLQVNRIANFVEGAARVLRHVLCWPASCFPLPIWHVNERTQRAIKKPFLVLGMVLAYATAPSQTNAPSPPVGLHIVGMLTISVAPQSQTVMAGRSASFTVVAAGDPPLRYQWTLNGANVGSNTNSYTRSNCQLSDNGGLVRVNVSNATNSVQSTTATLTVVPSGKLYYAAPNGSSSNTGSSTNSPWPLAYAIANAGASNTIMLMDGNYTGGGYNITTRGQTLRAINKWKAVIYYPLGNGFNINGPNVTIDGLQLDHAYVAGIMINPGGNNTTIRNCWIHHAARGDPNAVGNSDGSYKGSGIYGSAYALSNIVEYSLIESNGVWNGRDHGIYISGTNQIVRNNVFRYNWAFGIQLEPGQDATACDNCQVYNNLVYGNGLGPSGSGTGAPRGHCVTLWATTGVNYCNTTNYVYDNTFIGLGGFPTVDIWNGTWCLTNNIILGNVINNEDVAIIRCDYNLSTVSLSPFNGPHDVVSSTPNFVNPANGLYWLTSGSPARNRALSTLCGPVDFFGNAQSSVRDIGAVQYNATSAGDTRDLDPSPADPDYWLLP